MNLTVKKQAMLLSGHHGNLAEGLKHFTDDWTSTLTESHITLEGAVVFKKRNDLWQGLPGSKNIYIRHFSGSCHHLAIYLSSHHFLWWAWKLTQCPDYPSNHPFTSVHSCSSWYLIFSAFLFIPASLLSGAPYPLSWNFQSWTWDLKAMWPCACQSKTRINLGSICQKQEMR